MRRIPVRSVLGFALAFTLAVVTPAHAQPFDAWLVLTGAPTSSYIQIPDSPDLNPTAAFTFEAWVAIHDAPPSEDCRSLAGKDFLQAWWVAVCTIGGRPTLRSYLKGSVSPESAGVIPANQWTHIAVVYDGATRKHYINGEEVFSVFETGPLTTSTSEMRIGSDVSWPHTPAGAIDEVRLWSVARNRDQIRAWMNKPLAGIQTGLVGNWRLDANGNDALGVHDGTGVGASYLTSPVAPFCTTTATSLCLYNRFAVSVKWRDNFGAVNNGLVVPGVGTVQSGLLYFIAPDNWELLAKMHDGCSLNSRYWVFASGSTELFYRLEITDVTHGVNKIYFSYSGTNPPANTDTDAFAVCP